MIAVHATSKKPFYSHVNYSVTKMKEKRLTKQQVFYSHVNYSVTKIHIRLGLTCEQFYSHVNYSVTKICDADFLQYLRFTVT